MHSHVMRAAIVNLSRLLLLIVLIAAVCGGAHAAQEASSSTALSADLPKAVLPSHPPAIESVHGET